MIVLDASVALKWIFWDETGGERARHYRDRHVSGDEIIAVPDLFFMRSPMSCPIDHPECRGNVRGLFFVVEL